MTFTEGAEVCHYASVCLAVRSQQMSRAFDGTRGDTSPAYFSPIVVTRGRRRGWRRRRSSSRVFCGVKGCLQRNLRPQIPPVMEHSAGRTSIPAAFAKHALKENRASLQKSIHCVSALALLKNQVSYYLASYQLDFSIFRRNIHFVPNRDAIQRPTCRHS